MQLLKLRYLQLRRDLGFWVFIIATVVFFIVKSISEVSISYASGVAGAFLFLLYNYHSNRRDLNFISKYFTDPKKNLCLTYNLLTLPVSLALFVNQYWYLALGAHLLASLIIFIKIESGGLKLVFLSKYIPAAQFEWIAGLRKNLILVVLLFLIAIFFSPVKFFGVVALFLLNSIFLGFYTFFEPLVMLNPEGLSAETFFKKKIDFFSKILLILNVPLLLVNSIFHPDIAWFNVCFLVGFLWIASCSVYLKYENYKPNDEFRFNIDSLFLYASALIPFLLPVSFFLNASHKKKALQNFSNYTDDPR